MPRSGSGEQGGLGHRALGSCRQLVAVPPARSPHRPADLATRLPAVSTRPPQVSRLNLGGSGSKEEAAAPRRLSGGATPGASARPPIAKLNLSKLQRPEGEQENRTPLSARVSAAGAAAGASSGGATPRSARRTSPGSSTNWLKDASDSEGEEQAPDCSPDGVAAARAAPPANAADDPAFQIAMSPPRPLSSRGPAPQRPAVVPRLGLSTAGQQQQQPAAARASAAGTAAGRRLSQARSLRPVWDAPHCRPPLPSLVVAACMAPQEILPPPIPHAGRRLPHPGALSLAHLGLGAAHCQRQPDRTAQHAAALAAPKQQHPARPAVGPGIAGRGGGAAGGAAAGCQRRGCLWHAARDLWLQRGGQQWLVEQRARRAQQPDRHRRRAPLGVRASGRLPMRG